MGGSVPVLVGETALCTRVLLGGAGGGAYARLGGAGAGADLVGGAGGGAYVRLGGASGEPALVPIVLAGLAGGGGGASRRDPPPVSLMLPDAPC